MCNWRMHGHHEDLDCHGRVRQQHTAEQYLTLIDTTAPEVTAPAEHVATADGSCNGDSLLSGRHAHLHGQLGEVVGELDGLV